MAWQSALEQAKSVRLGRNTVIGLAAGVLVGLTLGLLIGWVWWPVEWQGQEVAPAAQTTSVDFAESSAQAQFLGAIADAFVSGSAAGDATAAAVAAQRLAVLGGDLRAAFRNANSFYSSQGGGAARINNLSTLALAVGIPLEDVAAAGDQSLQTPAVTQDEQTSGSSASDSAGNGGSTNWLVTLFTALLLIAGGFYILWILKQRQTARDVNAGGFVEEEFVPATTAGKSAFERDMLSPVRPALTPAASIRSNVDRPLALQEGSLHGFDSEESDVDEYGVEDEPEEVDERQTRYLTTAEADSFEDDALQEDEDVGEWEDSEDVGQPTSRPAPPTGFVTSVGATPPFTGVRNTTAGDLRPPPAEDAATGRSTPAVALQPPTPSRFERFAPVESYTATYYAGRVDFDYTKNLQTPDGIGYIGEYGIGIPDKRGLVNNDMEKAVVIDVYLFDKTDERQPIAISRSLLSLYADDHKRSEVERERETPSLPPIVAQPNTNFQLEGRVLLLDCQIKQVEYTPEGFFRNVTVELVLKRKN